MSSLQIGLQIILLRMLQHGFFLKAGGKGTQLTKNRFEQQKQIIIDRIHYRSNRIK